jgi:dihydroorotate dehydrogenase
MFRAIADGALINRMGFNNPGSEAVAQRLAAWRALGRWPRHPIGINLGKSKVTPLERAAEDYANSFRALWPHADFFVVNVSSPNTPNLRRLQDKAALDEILAALQAVNEALGQTRGGQGTKNAAQASQWSKVEGQNEAAAPRGGSGSRAKPILVKVAPDLSFGALDEVLELVGPRQIAGLVATNTTIGRPDTTDAARRRIYAEAGGLSGRPLRARATEIIRHLHRQTRGKLPIVGVGGIFNADDAWEKITVGASLVQLYTGLVFEGPGVVRRIVAGLARRLAAEGLKDLRQAVGIRA